MRANAEIHMADLLDAHTIPKHSHVYILYRCIYINTEIHRSLYIYICVCVCVGVYVYIYIHTLL